jgi:hypothetical protein
MIGSHTTGSATAEVTYSALLRKSCGAFASVKCTDPQATRSAATAIARKPPSPVRFGATVTCQGPRRPQRAAILFEQERLAIDAVY